MRFKWILIQLVTFSFATGAAELKIGVIDVHKAIFLTADGKKAKGQLETEFQRRRETLAKMQESMRKKSEDFERKTELLSHEARLRQEKEMWQEMKAFEKLVAQNQEEMTQMQERLLGPISRKIDEIVGKVARENNISLVLARSGATIVYSSHEVDLTDKVVALYEEGTKRSSRKKAASSERPPSPDLA